jgi:hypothetical protein
LANGHVLTLTIYPAKVLGIYLVIVGVAVALRRHYFVPVFGAFVEERLTRAVLSLAELLSGLFLVLAYNTWLPVPAAVITLIGWMAAIEASTYLLLPDKVIERLFGTFNTPTWYVVGGLLAVTVGLYLAAFGFGLDFGPPPGTGLP